MDAEQTHTKLEECIGVCYMFWKDPERFSKKLNLITLER